MTNPADAQRAQARERWRVVVAWFVLLGLTVIAIPFLTIAAVGVLVEETIVETLRGWGQRVNDWSKR